ncbi:MAG: Hsp33 family molecular chaperone HslO [Proteobacteria bacterium]|nr:MAG: Hsp33 family molecular chaperone HslO [Pseudomonadota bacterium]
MKNATNALLKSISASKEVVIYALDATDLVQESMERLSSFPTATNHVGQAMMASVLLQALSDSEENETFSLQWMCPGPFGHVYAESRNYGEVRGTIAEPQAAITDYATGLGEGLLQVRRAKGPIATTSVVKAKGSISLDVVEYLEQSEQKNCGIGLSVQVGWADEAKTQFKVTQAWGYLVHVLPQDTEEKMNAVLLRWDRQMEALGPVSQWGLRPDHTTLDMVRLLSSEADPKIVMNQRVIFSCNCSEDRAARALALLETQEQKEGVQLVTPVTEIRCEFCGRIYKVEAGKSAEFKKGGSV